MEISRRKEIRKRTIVYIYISIIIHVYLIFIGSVTIDEELLKRLFVDEAYVPRETVIENIIVKTVTESELPDEGFISENPNPALGEEVTETEENYNYINPDMSADTGELSHNSSDVSEVPDIDSASEFTLPDFQPYSPGSSQDVYQTGDYHTSLYDPDEKAEIVMNTLGDISLPTIPSEYAYYFNAMAETIGENWMEFFPVFQYYLGILQSGEIEIFIQLDEDGNVVDVNVIESFGYKVIDEALLNAVRYSKNFGPLPPNLPNEFYEGLPEGAAEEGDIGIIFKYVFVTDE